MVQLFVCRVTVGVSVANLSELRVTTLPPVRFVDVFRWCNVRPLFSFFLTGTNKLLARGVMPLFCVKGVKGLEGEAA